MSGGLKLVFQKFLYEITQISEKPSEAFTRMLLKTVGIHHVRDKALPEFQELVGAAFREFVNVKILQRLRIKNHQLSWWFDGEPLKAVLKDSATFGMGLWDH